MRIRYNLNGCSYVEDVKSVVCRTVKDSKEKDLLFFLGNSFDSVVAHLHQSSFYPNYLLDELFHSGSLDLRGLDVDFNYNEYEDVEEEREEKK